MGNYLSKYLLSHLGNYLGPPKSANDYWLPRSWPILTLGSTQDVLPKLSLRAQPPCLVPPGWDKVKLPEELGPEDWRRYDNKLPFQIIPGPEFSPASEGYWKHRPLAALGCPVKVRKEPPESSGGPANPKDVELKRKFDGRLWFEVREAKRGRYSPQPKVKRSAFKPVVGKGGEVRAFVPKRGELRQKACTWRCSLCKNGILSKPPVLSFSMLLRGPRMKCHRPRVPVSRPPLPNHRPCLPPNLMQ